MGLGSVENIHKQKGKYITNDLHCQKQMKKNQFRKGDAVWNKQFVILNHSWKNDYLLGTEKSWHSYIKMKLKKSFHQ